MSGGRRLVSGSIVATGAAINIDIVGFRPEKVDLYMSNGEEGHWASEMADAAAFVRTAAGAGSFVTVNGITPRANGFQIGTNATLNTAPRTIHWQAWD